MILNSGTVQGSEIHIPRRGMDSESEPTLNRHDNLADEPVGAEARHPSPMPPSADTGQRPPSTPLDGRSLAPEGQRPRGREADAPGGLRDGQTCWPVTLAAVPLAEREPPRTGSSTGHEAAPHETPGSHAPEAGGGRLQHPVSSAADREVAARQMTLPSIDSMRHPGAFGHAVEVVY